MIPRYNGNRFEEEHKLRHGNRPKFAPVIFMNSAVFYHKEALFSLLALSMRTF